MDLKELNTLLKTTGLPVAYRHFSAPPTLPYLVYLVDGTEHGGADDVVLLQNTLFLVELYSENKDLANEVKVEALLNTLGDYTAYEDYIEEEKLYKITYEIEFYSKK